MKKCFTILSFFIITSSYGQYTDYVYIKQNIINRFKQLLIKDEYEKTNDYNNRISKIVTDGTFDSICSKELGNIMKYLNVEVNVLKYNADTERYGINFFRNLQDYDNYFEKTGKRIYIGTDSISISVKEAKVKSSFFYSADGWRPKLVENWTFINEILIPSKITYYEHVFYLSNKGGTTITFLPSELGLKSSTNEKIIFDFQELQANKLFIEKNWDEINTIAWECLLDKEFKKALQILERGIPLINVKNKTLPYLLGNLAHAYLFNNQFDKAYKIYFNNDFQLLKINDMSWKEAVLQDFKEFEKSGIKSEDMKKIKKELLNLR